MNVAENLNFFNFAVKSQRKSVIGYGTLQVVCQSISLLNGIFGSRINCFSSFRQYSVIGSSQLQHMHHTRL